MTGLSSINTSIFCGAFAGTGAAADKLRGVAIEAPFPGAPKASAFIKGALNMSFKLLYNIKI